MTRPSGSYPAWLTVPTGSLNSTGSPKESSPSWDIGRTVAGAPPFDSADTGGSLVLVCWPSSS
jgi:hypothetical protein